MLVSEIRDEDTAESILTASLTGHLCFSSIHAGSIGGTLRRMVQMKLPTFAIQSGLKGVLCQRLLRRRCGLCRTDDPKDPAAPPQVDPQCQSCHGTGYAGRVPVGQMFLFDSSASALSVFDALIAGQSASEIDAIIESAGFASLREHANRLVAEGVTDAGEVYRVLGSPR